MTSLTSFLKNSVLSMYSSAVEALCVPTTLPARLFSSVMSVRPFFTKMIWRLSMYGSENSMFSLRFSVMSRPFQRTLTRPLLSSASLLDQSMALNSTSRPRRFDASFARSTSKPVISLFSSLKPIGGKLSSRPTMILPLSPEPEPLSAAFWPPQPVTKAAVMTAAIPNASNFFHFICHLSSFSSLSC